MLEWYDFGLEVYRRMAAPEAKAPPISFVSLERHQNRTPRNRHRVPDTKTKKSIMSPIVLKIINQSSHHLEKTFEK